MSRKSRVPDVMALAIERGSGFGFIDYEPRGVPGFTSDIATVFNRDESETDSLLEAVDELSDNSHFEVRRQELQPSSSGSKGKTYPKKIRVIVSPA